MSSAWTTEIAAEEARRQAIILARRQAEEEAKLLAKREAVQLAKNQKEMLNRQQAILAEQQKAQLNALRRTMAGNNPPQAHAQKPEQHHELPKRTPTPDNPLTPNRRVITPPPSLSKRYTGDIFRNKSQPRTIYMYLGTSTLNAENIYINLSEKNLPQPNIFNNILTEKQLVKIDNPITFFPASDFVIQYVSNEITGILDMVILRNHIRTISATYFGNNAESAYNIKNSANFADYLCTLSKKYCTRKVGSSTRRQRRSQIQRYTTRSRGRSSRKNN